MNISVAITCHNEREFIGAAIDSALEQNVKPHGVSVVDDGSTDRSWEVILDHGHYLAGRVDLIQVTQRGLPAARTAGAMAAIADGANWVIFLDGDDSLAPDFVEEVRRLALMRTCDIVFPECWREGDHKPRHVLYEHPSVEQLRQVFPGYGCFAASAELIVAMGGFHPAMQHDQDWDFVLDARIRGARFGYADTYFRYRNNPRGLTAGRTLESRQAERAEMTRHHA